MAGADVPGDDEIDPLTRLAIKHGTDKWGPHFYTPIYHELFAHLRDKPVRLLEIGVGGYDYKMVGGASLAMWAEYFPHGRIVGIDTAPKTLSLDPRVSLLVGSQADPAFLANLCDQHGPFDVVIDDGSHIPQHVATSFYALFPRLSQQALYVIEDVQTAFWPQFGGSILDGGATMKLAQAVLGFLNHAELKVVQPKLQVAPFAKQIRSLRAFHNIIVVEKGDNNEPSNFAFDLENPHAARAMRIIKQVLARSPSPEGFANLIGMLAAGGHDEAESLTDQALAQWPDHPALLVAAADTAALAGDTQRALRYMERLLAIEPDNMRLRQSYEATKMKSGSGDSKKAVPL